MVLRLYYHPLASFCHEVQFALYENATPFEPFVVDLADASAADALRKISPMGKMPALVDEGRGHAVWESTILIEYLDQFHPGETRFLSDDRDQAWRIRMWDRFYDQYVHDPMQRIVADRLRPEAKRDADAVEQAKTQLRHAYDVIEKKMASKDWAAGDAFTLADCAAAPALFYANILKPFSARDENLAAYLGRLMARPSYARVLDEAKPFFRFFPFEGDLKLRYPALGVR